MKCPSCKQRWADFRDEDYEFKDSGIHARHDKAHERRMEEFSSDEPRYCGCLEREGVDDVESLSQSPLYPPSVG